jgi:type IV secretion system protein VirB2
MKKYSNAVSKGAAVNNVISMFKAMLFVALLSTPQWLFAAAAGGAVDFGGTCDTVSSFFTGVEGMLKFISVLVITVAIIFCGYQIAFAHKRISDVAPVFLGALLIGGATTIATMLMSADTNASTGC